MFVLLRQLRSIRRAAQLERGSDGRWLGIRHVDAGSCNGCEHELGLITNPLHDIQRFGIDVVASPRHADILLITGPITTRMAEPLRIAYEAMPTPRIVAALGNCALGCNVLGDPGEMIGSVEQVLPVDIRIPGCPPTPEEIASHLLEALGARSGPPSAGGQGTSAHRDRAEASAATGSSD